MRFPVDVRVVLFTGGEGTARVAAATAGAAARRGRHTVLLGAGAGEVAGLQVRAPRPLAWMDEVWPKALEAIARAGEIPPLPGAAELQLWAQLRECLCEDGSEVVIVDCGPLDRLAGFLSIAESLSWLADRAVPPQDHEARAVIEYAALLQATAATVRTAASVRVVLGADADLLADTRRATGRIAFHGYGLDGIVVGRLLPHGEDPWLAAESARQQAVLAELETEFAGVPVHRLGWDEDPAALYAAADPVAPGAAFSAPVLERHRQDYDWVLPMPCTDRAQLALARSGDELILTREQDRRILPLPSGLRRCTLTGAQLRDGQLRLRFTPDAALWPEPEPGSVVS